MAYKVIILYQLYMPSYFLGTFTEYPFLFILLQTHFLEQYRRSLLAGKARREKIHPEEILFGVYRCANDWPGFYKTSSGEIGL